MMPENSSHVTAGVRNCLFLALMLLLSFTSEAECQNLRPVWRDIALANGEVLTNVKVTKIDPDGLKVMSDAGLSKVMFNDLDPAVQKEFGYDPEKAASFTAQDREAARANSLAVQESVARQMAESAAAQTSGESSVSGGTNIVGALPKSFSSSQVYWLNGLFLLQSVEQGWVTDMIPKLMYDNFPHQLDADGLVFNDIMKQYIVQGLYTVGRQRVVLVPSDQEAFQKLNLADRGTLLSARGKFVKFEAVDLANGGSTRVPIFVIDRIKLWTGQEVKLGTLD